MHPHRASMTALGVAYARAYHYQHHHPRIFEDSVALGLILPSEMEVFNDALLDFLRRARPELAVGHRESQLARAALLYPAVPIVVGRARHNEDRLTAAIAGGVTQYVIVGAGIDTFAWRRADLSDRVGVFEIDHPATQAFKRERTGEAGLTLPSNLHFTPADFEKESVANALARVPFDPGARTFFSWHGVTYYLTREAINETFRSIRSAAAPGSEVVFDYFEARFFIPDNQSLAVRHMFELVASWGEPFVTGLEPASLGNQLAAVGFELIEDLGRADQQQRYFAGRSDGLEAIELDRLAVGRAA